MLDDFKELNFSTIVAAPHPNVAVFKKKNGKNKRRQGL